MATHQTTIRSIDSSPNPASTGDFRTRWNALERGERLRIRRLVRLGRVVEPRSLGPIAVEYAAFQRSRLWAKFFWIWFIPGLVIGLGAAVQIHSIVFGIVLMLAIQAVFTWFNLRRAARINQ